MRVLTTVLIAGLLLSALPTASAQSEPWMEDDQGDAVAQTAAGPMQPARPAGPTDLVSLDVSESDRYVQFTIGFADLDMDETRTPFDGAMTSLRFDLAGVDYLVETYYGPAIGGGGGFHYADLYLVEERDGDQYTTFLDDLDSVVKLETNSIAIDVPRDILIDASGAPARVGHSFTDVWVESITRQGTIYINGNTPLVGYEIVDRMPDEDFGPVYDVVFGVVQEGDARLSSQSPFRLSNGGATTLVYEVQARNHGDRQAFRLGLENVPTDWDVSLPYERFVLDEGERSAFPVLVTTPSGHQHGGAEAFLLTMTGEQDASDVGRLELGIKYADIPQPAGHHPRLWLHSSQDAFLVSKELDDALGAFMFRDDGLYMNALEDDVGDQGIDIKGNGASIPGFESEFWWTVPLQPFLEMGLDFDTSQQGEITIPIRYDYLAQDVYFEGALFVYSGEIGDSVQVGTILPTERATWQTGKHSFEAVIEIEDEADFIPYSKDMFMWMDLRVQGTFIGPALVGPGTNAYLTPGGSLELPLNEYRDPVETFYEAVRSLAFGSDYLERPVNPAETVIFETHLRNSDSTSQVVALNLTGVNAQWATIIGADAFELAPGEERDIAIAVTAPADVQDGAIADLVLQAVNEADPNKRALLDLIALVDEEADHPDQSEELDALSADLSDEKKSPGFEVAAILLGLLAILLVARRQE